MGTPELAVWQGIFFREDSKLQPAISAKGTLWIDRMADVFLDIEHGLGAKNRTTDKVYWRLKLANILLANVLKGEKLLSTPSLFSKVPEYCNRSPTLWGEFFDCVSVLGLGPEMAEMMLGIEPEVQEYICNQILHWIDSNESAENRGSACSSDCNAFLLAISLFIGAKLLQATDKDAAFLLSQIENVLKSVFDARDQEDLSKSPCGATVKCQFLMLKRLQSLYVDAENSLKKDGHENSDVFYVSNLSYSLSAASIQSISGNDSKNNANDLLAKLGKIKRKHLDTIKTDEMPHAKSTKFAQDYIKFVLERSNKSNNSERSFATVLRGLLNLLGSVEDLTEGVKFLDQHQESSKDDKRLYTIAHRLGGYEDAVQTLLAEMVQDPTKNESWKEAFICLGNSVECLATRTNALLTADGVTKCVANSEKEDLNVTKKRIETATSFQQLFWSGFLLLRLSDKIKIAEKILSNTNLAFLMVEYPLKHFEKASQKIHTFEQSQKKKIKLFFDCLIQERNANGVVLEKFCEVLVTSPEDTIHKIVQQALRSHEQCDLVKDLLLNFGCVFQFQNKDTKSFVLWDSFCKLITLHWGRNEASFVENGLYFIQVMMKSESMSQRDPSGHLMKSIFNSVMASLCEAVDSTQSNVHTEHRLPEKFAIKLLSCIVGIPVFFTFIPAEKIMALCFCLGDKLENSIYFWDSDKNFDEEVHELLIEVLEFLVTKTAGKLDIAEESDKMLCKWISKVIPSFNWTIQLRFVSILKLLEGYKISVPACLSEICILPDLFEPCEELSYGVGSGLLAWHQCFVANSSLCPLSSLDLGNLTPEGVKLFSNGWIVTLSQILAYCLPNQWFTLMETSKILISDFKVYMPFGTKYVMTLPTIDLSETYVILGVVQLLSQIFELLSRNCCVTWTSPRIWSHLSKCYCMVLNSLINDSAEFDRADAGAKAFMLGQIFCTICDMTVLFHHLPQEKLSPKASENLFILSLDVISSFEKILTKVKATQKLSEESDSDASGRGINIESSNLETPGWCHQKSVLEISDRLQEMMLGISHLPDKENQQTLLQKLSSLSDLIKEF